MHKLKGEISQKKNQIRILEQRMIGSIGHAPNNSEMSQVTETKIYFEPPLINTAIFGQRELKEFYL